MKTPGCKKVSLMVPIGVEKIPVKIKGGNVEFKIPPSLGNDFSRCQLMGVICDTLVVAGVIDPHHGSSPSLPH